MIYWQLFEKNPGIVKAALIGCGDFGRYIQIQGVAIPRMDMRMVCDIIPERGIQGYQEAGVPDEQIVLAETAEAAREAYSAGKYVVVRDAAFVLLDDIQVVMVATRIPEAGAQYAYQAIDAGKHVVMVDKEADSVIGPILKHYADRKGVVYTTDDGDEPGLNMGLVGWARELGLEVYSTGNLHACDYNADTGVITIGHTSFTIAEEDKVWMRPMTIESDMERVLAERARICACREPHLACADPLAHLSVAGNGTGIAAETDIGLRPIVYRAELANVLVPRSMGGIKDTVASVDTPKIISDRRTSGHTDGVYIVAGTNNKVIMDKIEQKTHTVNWRGNAFALLRPYHLCGVETSMSALCAGLLGVATGGAKLEQLNDIVCYPNRDIRAGEQFGPIGNSGWSDVLVGKITRLSRMTRNEPIPFFMLEGNTAACDIPAGTMITPDMVNEPQDSYLWRLRRELETILY